MQEQGDSNKPGLHRHSNPKSDRPPETTGWNEKRELREPTVSCIGPCCRRNHSAQNALGRLFLSLLCFRPFEVPKSYPPRLFGASCRTYSAASSEIPPPPRLTTKSHQVPQSLSGQVPRVCSPSSSACDGPRGWRRGIPVQSRGAQPKEMSLVMSYP